jgi:hypothetical protein
MRPSPLAGRKEHQMFDRTDLELVSKAYRDGQTEGGLQSAYRRASTALLDRHPELSALDEKTLTLRVTQVLSTALLTGHLSQL